MARLVLLKTKDELGSSFIFVGERNKDKLTNQSNQATGQTNYVCLVSHFPPHSFP